MGVGSGKQESRGPFWIFIHNTDIVDRGLKVLFFSLCLLFCGLFSVGPPGNFFAAALGCEYQLLKSFGLTRLGNRTQVYQLLAQK